MARHDRSESPAKRRKSPSRRDRSPPRRRSSRRSESPVRATSSHKTRSSEREKPSSRGRSPRTTSPPPRSPSPRTKRLRKVQAERVREKSVDRRREREDERNESDLKERGRGREKQKKDLKERAERRSERDADEPSTRKRERSYSPLDHPRGEKLGSRSRSKDRKPKEYDEVDFSLTEVFHILACFLRVDALKVKSSSNVSQAFARAACLNNDNGAGGLEPNGNDDDSVARMKAAEEALAAKKKEQPSFELSGKLADETNRVKGVTLLFNEPPEARKPDIRWRLYVFKAGEMLNEPLYIHRQSCYLFGRERRVADIPTDHPSCSKQHAVIQYRQIEKEQTDGMLKKVTRPYLMDLGSTNGTFINDNRLEPERYYELIEQDTIKFGNSSREYVILHENSAKDE
ncbi:unnamed protein product [Rhodiola kirilowii]